MVFLSSSPIHATLAGWRLCLLVAGSMNAISACLKHSIPVPARPGVSALAFVQDLPSEARAAVCRGVQLGTLSLEVFNARWCSHWTPPRYCQHFQVFPRCFSPSFQVHPVCVWFCGCRESVEATLPTYCLKAGIDSEPFSQILFR